MANTVTYDSITIYDSTLVTYDGDIVGGSPFGRGIQAGGVAIHGKSGEPGTGGSSGRVSTKGGGGEPNEVKP